MMGQEYGTDKARVRQAGFYISSKTRGIKEIGIGVHGCVIKSC